MKIEKLPDFAKPFKTKGYDVRLVKNKYQLFKVSSSRVEGKSYPVLKQEYVGTIDPVKGLIPKKLPVDKTDAMVEYGLSHFILKHFKRRLVRSTYTGCTNVVIILGIIHFMYGHTEERFIRLSYLFNTYRKEPEPTNIKVSKRVLTISEKIDSFLKEMFTDDADRDYLIAVLRSYKVNAVDDQ